MIAAHPPRKARVLPPVRIAMRSVAAFAWVGFGYLFLWAPLIVVVGASFDGGSRCDAVSFPQNNPSLLWIYAIAPSLLAALKLSVMLDLVAALCACLLGIPEALGHVRASMRGKTVIG